MPITNRFSTTTNGALAITGNTLGLSKISNQNRAGTIGAIGAFITTNTALQVPTFPAGTTLNYIQNSSTAILNIPAGSTILYAEIIWGGNYLSRDQNITSVLGNPVSFTTPVSTYSITPSAVTASKQTFVSGSVTFGFYTRSADVTSLVQAGYTTGSLPADAVATITFKVLVTSIPSNSTIINSATVTAALQLTPQDPIITFIVNSNIVRIPVQFITATVVKNASVSSAYLNQYFDYTVRITDTSEISLSNISLQDAIPAGLQFMNGTVFINEERSPLANPNIGFLVATNLEPNETIILVFTVQVISPPVNNEFKNTANISLQLQFSPTDPPITVTVTSNENIVTFVPENQDETLPNLNCFFDRERFIRITPRYIRNYFWTWMWWR